MKITLARARRRRWLVYLVVVPMVVVVGFPLYWMVNTALTTQVDLYAKPQSLFPSLAHLGQISHSFGKVPLAGMFSNSTFIATGTAILSVLLGLVSAYALSRFRFRGKGIIGFFLFATQMVPDGMFLIPLYTMFISLGLVNNLWGLVILNATLTLPVSTFVIKAGIDTVPVELDEAARIDNCPRLGILLTVILPLVFPSVVAAAVLAFFEGWGEVMFASTFLSDPGKFPASVELFNLSASPEASTPIIMGAAVLYTSVPIVFFLFIQRRIITGLTAGAVKG
jgi:multiple sugar transport system permease protein